MTIIMQTAKIAYFRFILEGYDGLATLTTLDAKQGLVVLRFPHERVSEVKELLFAIRDELDVPSSSRSLDNIRIPEKTKINESAPLIK